MPAKRRAPPTPVVNVPKAARQSKLAKENDITAQEETEIKEAFKLFAQAHDGEKEGVIPIGDVRKAMIALNVPPTAAELGEFIEILDPESEGFATYSSFVAICALKLHAKDDDDGTRNDELEEAYSLFTNGGDGPIMVHHLKRVAQVLKEDISDDMLRDMVLEANGGAGIGKGVRKDDFEQVMRRAGVWK